MVRKTIYFVKKLFYLFMSKAFKNNKQKNAQQFQIFQR